MSSQGTSQDNMEIHSHSENDSEYEPENEGGDHGADPGAQSSSMASAAASTGCPSELLAPYARGHFDPKSPLKQFASQISVQGTASHSSGGTRKWKCNICDREWFGSISRVNAHFLFWRGKGVKHCKFLEEPKNIQYRIEFNRLWGVPDDTNISMPTTLSARASLHDSRNVPVPHTYHASQAGGMMFGSPSTSTSTVARTGKRKLHTPQSNPIADMFNVQLRDEIDESIGNFFFANGIPFHVSRSPYYRKMIDMVAKGGPSYVPPRETKMRTSILDKSYSKINILMEKMKACWVALGCSIVMDGWTNISHRPLINIMVTCAEGPYFLRAVDCTGHRKDADFQFQVLREAIEEVGPQNVVQVVTDAAYVCRAAGRLVEAAYRHIWWTPCCVHAMNNALKDMGKIDWIRGVVTDARDVQMFICNHHISHALFRTFAKKEFLKPVETRYASYFILLERMIELQEALQLMVMTNEWNRWAEAKTEQGRRVKEIVKSDVFWTDTKYIVSIISPVFQVIRYGDGDAPNLGEVYECIDSMLGQMRAAVRVKDPSLAFYNEQIRPIIQSRWDKLNTPLHMAAFALNPKWYKARPGRTTPIEDDEVKAGFFRCIEKMFDSRDAGTIRTEWGRFATLRGYSDAAKMDIDIMAQEDPLLWWKCHGPKSLTTTLAIRLLSQVSSSSAAERNWSTYSFIHSLKRNRLTSKRAEKLVAVHSALRLIDRKTLMYKESPAARWDVEPEEPSQIDEDDPTTSDAGLVGVSLRDLDPQESSSSSEEEFADD
ncbi:uncharacterized protein LOC131873636 [Cryptomeria japonica]|uniref:uncharacterized protein LOC131873636 n=1 Tax=Cryptomeria japonica TaxID=3369 RepID=UPI0027DA03F8|nr:uncharacterized protein LOC131873636 [Cryptomeria japonica]